MSLFSEFPALKRVPNFVGLDFDGARTLELASGFRVRHPERDAPPITGHWGANRQLVVGTQTPPAGSLLRRGEGVSITLEEPQVGSPASGSETPAPERGGHAQAD